MPYDANTNTFSFLFRGEVEIKQRPWFDEFWVFLSDLEDGLDLLANSKAETEAARQTEDSLLLNLTRNYVPRTGITFTIELGGQKITGSGDGTNPTDLVTFQQLEAAGIMGTNTPYSIGIDAFNPSAITSLQLVTVNAAGDAVVGVSLPANAFLSADENGAMKGVSSAEMIYLTGGY